MSVLYDTYPKAAAITKTTQMRPTSIVKVKATMPAMDRKYIPTVVPLKKKQVVALDKYIGGLTVRVKYMSIKDK